MHTFPNTQFLHKLNIPELPLLNLICIIIILFYFIIFFNKIITYALFSVHIVFYGVSGSAAEGAVKIASGAYHATTLGSEQVI